MRVENARIEDVVAVCEEVPDLITARALKPVKTLLNLAEPLLGKKPDLKMLLLKGENVDQEIEDALESYSFELEQYPSITNALSSIILISSIRTKP